MGASWLSPRPWYSAVSSSKGGIRGPPGFVIGGSSPVLLIHNLRGMSPEISSLVFHVINSKCHVNLVHSRQDWARGPHFNQISIQLATTNVVEDTSGHPIQDAAQGHRANSKKTSREMHDLTASDHPGVMMGWWVDGLNLTCLSNGKCYW